MTGRLENDPARLLGHSGRVKKISTKTAMAAAPMMKNDSCQPKKWPRLVPIGTPSTVATMVPPMTLASPRARFPCGATRAARGVMIDQNTECESATPMRATRSVPKLVTHGTTKWQTANKKSRNKRSLRRSSLAVSTVKGSDITATTKA